MTALSNFDIEDYYKGNPKFGGCPCNDELGVGNKYTFPRDPKKFYIINMSKREDGGSHWTLLFEDIYFDSFGCAPTTAIQPFVSVWNDTPYQDFHSSACGFYCIYVADNLLAGRDPVQGLIPDDDETPQRSSELVLRRHFQGTKAGGLFDRLKNRFLPRKAESERLRKFLDGKGSQEVTKIEIARKPVQSTVTGVLNLLSRGKLQQKRKELGYPDIMHNYLLVTLKDGSTYRVENNHQVEATPAKKSDYNGQRANVPVTTSRSLKDMITVASKDDPKFWRYDARSSNCQTFTKKMLERNGLAPANDPPPFEIEQDAKALTDTLPTKGKLAKVVTDVAQYADQVLHGGGVTIAELNKWY